MRKKFIRVFLHSGTKWSPLGEEEIAVYCQCDDENILTEDVNVIDLEKWVNNNRKCKKNQNNDDYKVLNKLEAFNIVELNEQEIKSCYIADRIFPRLENYQV